MTPQRRDSFILTIRSTLIHYHLAGVGIVVHAEDGVYASLKHLYQFPPALSQAVMDDLAEAVCP